MRKTLRSGGVATGKIFENDGDIRVEMETPFELAFIGLMARYFEGPPMCGMIKTGDDLAIVRRNEMRHFMGDNISWTGHILLVFRNRRLVARRVGWIEDLELKERMREQKVPGF